MPLNEDNTALASRYLLAILRKARRIGDVQICWRILKTSTCCKFTGYIRGGKYFCNSCADQIQDSDSLTPNEVHTKLELTNVWSPHCYNCLQVVGQLRRCYKCLTCLQKLYSDWKQWEHLFETTVDPLIRQKDFE